MGALDSLLVGLDQGVTGFFGSWNSYTTAIATLLVAVVLVRIVTAKDPDTHPMLLARQSQSTPVRHEGESAVYRGHGAPHSLPLNAGLNVKEQGAPKWSRGRNGDLRDIWRRAALGAPDEDGKPSAGKGRLLTAHGSSDVEEHSLEDITRQINLIGQHIHEQGGIRVAIYLPNSVELLASLFACSFYPNLTAVLLPFDVSEKDLIWMIRRSAIDTVITTPGAFPFDAVVKAYPTLRQLIWVANEGNRHIDWNEVPQGTGGSVNVATWQDIIQEAPHTSGRELPPSSADSQKHEPTDVIFFWTSKPGSPQDLVRFTQANLISGIAGLLGSVPVSQRLGPADLFLPADSLTNTYTLLLTMGALFSNSSVALTSVANNPPDLVLATQGVAPTVIVATPEALLRTHADSSTNLAASAAAKLSYWLKTRSLVRNGVFPAASAAASEAYRPAVGINPGKLRLVFTAERAGAESAPLSPRELSDLRVFLGARVLYALTAAKVAGAVTQISFYDYKVADTGARSHFGPPVTSVEVFLRDIEGHKSTDEKYEGEIIVRGPSVAGSENEAALGVAGKISEDNTLAYA